MFVHVYMKIIEPILTKPFIFIIDIDVLLFFNTCQVNTIINNVKVSFNTKNNFPERKLMSRSPNTQGVANDLPFFSNVKLSIVSSILQILYLFA